MISGEKGAMVARRRKQVCSVHPCRRAPQPLVPAIWKEAYLSLAPQREQRHFVDFIFCSRSKRWRWASASLSSGAAASITWWHSASVFQTSVAALWQIRSENAHIPRLLDRAATGPWHSQGHWHRSTRTVRHVSNLGNYSPRQGFDSQQGGSKSRRSPQQTTS